MNSTLNFKPKYFLVWAMVFLTSFSAFAKPKPAHYYAVIYSENNLRFKGNLEKVSEKGLTIDYFGKSKFISADSIKSIKIKRSVALKKYALIGSAGGLLAGAAIYNHGNQQGKLSILALPVVLIAGTLAGATIGALVNTMTSVEKHQISNPADYRSLYSSLIRYSDENRFSEN